MLPPERRDTTNVRPDDYSRRPEEARKNVTVRTDYSTSPQQRKPNSLNAKDAWSKLQQQAKNAQASLPRPQQTTQTRSEHYMPPTQAAASPWGASDANAGGNIAQELDNAITRKARDVLKSPLGQRLTKYTDALKIDPIAFIEQQLRKSVNRQVAEEVQNGGDRDIVQRQMIELLHSREGWKVFLEDRQTGATIVKYIKWFIIGIILLNIFF